MGRRPIGKRAMTDAERQRRHRGLPLRPNRDKRLRELEQELAAKDRELARLRTEPPDADEDQYRDTRHDTERVTEPAITRGKPRPAAARTATYPPLPKLTREQIGAPAEGTENEQDPDSPPGVTRAQAHIIKYGHVHIRPLSDKLRADREKKVTSFVAALQDLLQHSMEPEELLATLRAMKGKALRNKFEERMDAVERLLTQLNALRRRVS